ncbi:hypothetical protein BsWGS_28115 [Bradybaena similaris]
MFAAPEHCLNYESSYHIARACDCVVYQSYGLSSGRFTSPNFPQSYPPNINCILYTFIGDATEIVELTFIEFDLKMPDPSGRCLDFVRVYQNLERPEVNEYSHHDLEFCGGYNSIQNTIYSSGRSLVLEFHSDFRQGKPGNYSGFKGVFHFLDKANYITSGSREDSKRCDWDFRSNSSHHNGKFFSPSYPQNYKPNSSCRYRFFARPGERVRVLFTNIQLHHIDASCRDSPDVITVYDGTDNTSAVINQFCGVHNAEEVISTGTNLYVAFACDDRNQKQGFAATYEFINKIPSKEPKSIKNEFQCNQKIESAHHQNGTISSPYHPEAYPPQITCRYEFIGVGRERIQLRFLHLDLYYANGDPMDAKDCQNSDSVTVYVYTNGQMQELKTWCGRKLPPMVMSSQHTMTVEFHSIHSSSTVTGFKAQYSFVTNFGITEGQQDNRGTCAFNYQSSVKSEGEITSPNYNGLYPRNTECHYLFYGRGKERVHITFLDFDVDGLNPRCEESTSSDYVSFSNFADSEDRKMTRMCGQSSQDKREIWSDGPFFRVTFKSNERYDSTGFQAFYQFRGVSEDNDGKQDHQTNNRGSETFEIQGQNRNSGNSAHTAGRKSGYSYLPMNSYTSLMIVCCIFLLFFPSLKVL